MRKITEAEKDKTVRDILQMLNGLRQYDASEILYEVHKQVDDSLWLIVPEDKFPAQVLD